MSDSYYGKPIINPPVWEELDIAGYLFTGGLSGACAIVAAAAEETGRPRLARRARLGAVGAIGVSFAALIHDLGRPERFLNMLRVFKPTSPMSVGVWILVAYSPLAAASAAGDVLDRAPRTRRAAGLGAGVLGSAVASYTAALIADTAVPAWHDGFRELPFLFVGSAASAGAGFGLLVGPREETGPVRRLAVLAAAGELVAEQLLERRLGPVAEPLKRQRRLKAAKALTALGALAGGRAGGAALLAGSALTRFGLFAAGMESARDPRYTVEPQRATAAREPSA
jgi:hypothetical protein